MSIPSMRFGSARLQVVTLFALAVGLGACGSAADARPGGIGGTEDEPGAGTADVEPSYGSDDGGDETGDDTAGDSSSGGEPEEPMQEATVTRVAPLVRV